jgi:hypothetical protein
MGKTTLAVDIIISQIIPSVRRIFVVCPTFWQQPAFSRLHRIKGAFGKNNVFTKVGEPVFERIFAVLNSVRAPTLLIVDDAAAEASTNKGNKGAFSRLCLASPHLNLTIVGCFQRLTSCSPALRDNAEGLISFIPTKIIDVDTIYREFNPSPADCQSRGIVYDALQIAWESSRFAFIWRENFTGIVKYFCGFNGQINFHQHEFHEEGPNYSSIPSLHQCSKRSTGGGESCSISED